MTIESSHDSEIAHIYLKPKKKNNLWSLLKAAVDSAVNEHLNQMSSLPANSKQPEQDPAQS